MDCDANNHGDRKWSIFIIASAVIYGVGLIGILIGYYLKSLVISKRKKAPVKDTKKGWYLRIKERAATIENGKSPSGKILMILSLLANMIAFGIYIDYSEVLPLEFCNHDTPRIVNIMELILYVFFLLHFLLRFVVATDKVTFWVFNPFTYVEIFTLPLVFIQNVIGTGWLGFRFLRMIYIKNLLDILTSFGILGVGSAYDIGNLLSELVTLMFASAGMVHLLENTGDFWAPLNYGNRRELNYFECIYFMVVTFSTVGYGDISCKTYLGRFFSLIAIVFGLGLFAAFIPAIFEFLTSHSKYTRNYKSTPGNKHVVVTGHITDKSVASFLQDFLHPDRQCESNVSVVFLYPELPSMAIQAILLKHCMSVFYFTGTVYKLKDCKRVQMEHCDAVIVLCDKKCENPEAEDAENITRVISMKKFFRKIHIRCIVQLMRKESKANLQNLHLWDEAEHGDAIVCTDELKLGFMAQSCNSPGFSSLLANLFIMRRADSSSTENVEDWKRWYLHGVSCEIYSTKLSSHFTGMTFPKVAKICFQKLRLLLIAVELETENGKYFAINPKEDVKLVKNTRAFLIAQDSKSVRNAEMFCGNCHTGIDTGKLLSKCKCSRIHSPADGFYKETRIELDMGTSPYTYHKMGKKNAIYEGEDSQRSMESPREQDAATTITNDDKKERKEILFDETGTYFWCEQRRCEDVFKTIEEAEQEHFFGHVIILVISDLTSPSLGLRQLIQPLRASNQPANKLKKIVILGDIAFLRREWKSISTFPDVYIVKGSAYRRRHLHAINVHLADMCIVLSPCHAMHGVEKNCEEEAMSDKEVIMVTLTLRAMKFDKAEDDKNKKMIPAKPNRRTSSNAERYALQFIEKVRQKIAFRTNSADFQIRKISGETIRMITELVYDSNTLYMDDDEEDMAAYDSGGIWMTQSYACGSVFTTSVLDFLASATYFNRDILTFVQCLVTSSVNPELDEILSFGRQPNGTKETPMISAMRNRCRIEQLTMQDPIISNRGEYPTTYSQLFLTSLELHGALCIGLYRLHEARSISQKSLNKRYVINFPPPDFRLVDTDLVFILLQFDKDTDFETNL